MSPSLQSHITLRDARRALIRPAQPADYPSLLETLRAVALEDRGVVRTPQEFPDSAAEIEKWNNDTSRTGARGCWFVAVLDERVIGEADVRRFALRRLRHVAHVGISVHPAFQRQGVGRALMNAIVDWCRFGPGADLGGVVRLDLNVLADNLPAIAMYQSLGFEVEGRRRRFLRRENGDEVDDLLMARFLDV